MAEAAIPETVYNIASKRYGKEYDVTLENGVVKLRKGWNLGADIRCMAGGSMQGPNDKVFVTQKSYVDEHGGRIIKNISGICALLGVLGFWFLFSGGDVVGAVVEGPQKFGMTPGEMRRVTTYSVYCIVFGGMLVGSAGGWISAYVATSLLNTRADRIQNRMWTDALRAFLNKNL